MATIDALAVGGNDGHRSMTRARSASPEPHTRPNSVEIAPDCAALSSVDAVLLEENCVSSTPFRSTLCLIRVVSSLMF
jgi:hypothetical protein